jgi:hypothetical protein
MAQKLLTKSADILLDQGFEQIASMKRTSGIDATLFKRDGEKYLVGAKQYAYQNLASFQLQQVEQAVEEDLMPAFYADESEQFTVFDPDFIMENAEESHGESTRGQVEWREIPRSHGADLTGYVYGAEEPEKLSGNNQELGAFV